MTVTKALLLTLLLVIIFSTVQLGILLSLSGFYEKKSTVFRHFAGLSTVIGFLISYILIFHFFWKSKFKELKSEKINEYKFSIFGYILIIGLGLEFFYQPFFDIEKILNFYRNEEFLIDYPGSYKINLNTKYQALSAIFIAPIFEELFFRKFILAHLLKKYNKIFALIISSLCFSVIHIETPNNLIPTFMFGIISGLILIKTNKILYSIGLHLIMNSFWFILLIYGEKYYQWIYNLNFNYVYWCLIPLGASLIILGIRKITTANIV